MADKKQPKFTLSKLLHRTQKLDLKADVIIDGKTHLDYIVGWVRLRGATDPKYINQAVHDLVEYKEVAEDKDATPEQIKEAAKLFQDRSVTNAIIDWDESFFEMKFTPENALKVFDDRNNAIFYNQIATYMQKREDFLPVASQ